MTANRLVPTSASASPLTGPVYMDDVAEEIVALWKYAIVPLGTIAGTANDVTAVSAVPIAAYADGQQWLIIAASTNTGSMTINIDTIGVKDLMDKHGAAMKPGLFKSGGMYRLRYDNASGDVWADAEPGRVGRQELWTPAARMVTRTSAGAAAGTTETATNKVMRNTFDFDTTTQEHAQFSFRAPKRWNLGTMTARFVWTHAATTTNFTVRWGIQGLALSDDDAADVAFGTGVTVDDIGGTTDDIYITSETAAFTLSNTPAAGDWLTFQVYRDPSVGGDMAIDARLIGVHLFWTSDKNEEV